MPKDTSERAIKKGTGELGGTLWLSQLTRAMAQVQL